MEMIGVGHTVSKTRRVMEISWKLCRTECLTGGILLAHEMVDAHIRRSFEGKLVFFFVVPFYSMVASPL